MKRGIYFECEWDDEEAPDGEEKGFWLYVSVASHASIRIESCHYQGEVQALTEIRLTDFGNSWAKIRQAASELLLDTAATIKSLTTIPESHAHDILAFAERLQGEDELEPIAEVEP